VQSACVLREDLINSLLSETDLVCDQQDRKLYSKVTTEQLFMEILFYTAYSDQEFLIQLSCNYGDISM
jgi:hypothetical protein